MIKEICSLTVREEGNISERWKEVENKELKFVVLDERQSVSRLLLYITMLQRRKMKVSYHF